MSVINKLEKEIQHNNIKLNSLESEKKIIKKSKIYILNSINVPDKKEHIDLFKRAFNIQQSKDFFSFCEKEKINQNF